MEKRPVIYVTRDIERALGMTPNEHYHIVSNRNPYSQKIKEQYPDFVTLIDNPGNTALGTAQLLEDPLTEKVVNQLGGDILVFKNTARIEPIILTKKWRLLNPKAVLSESVENKISQIDWLGEMGKKYLPRHEILPASNIQWNGKPRIIQWGHGHTGDGTFLIRTRDDLQTVQMKFPKRIARVSDYILGPSFTVNVVVASNKILIGNISYQITGVLPFTNNEFSTIGNDWSVSLDLLSPDEIEMIGSIAGNIGKKLNIAGWRGLFGIDIIREDISNKIYLIEINARQPASSTFESFLQEENRKEKVEGITIFEAHIRALQDDKIDQELIVINDGAQLVQRITNKISRISPSLIPIIDNLGCTYIVYQNEIYNSDLLRIQSKRGFIESHGKFNARGKEILALMSKGL